VIFYTEGCHICDAEKAAARSLVSETKDVKVLMVNIDRIMADDPALANKLFDSFDLSSLPYILITDKKGKITVRYATLQ
jgi:thiol-disulfide isomerase/thioredoxin